MAVYVFLRTGVSQICKVPVPIQDADKPGKAVNISQSV